MQFVFKINQVMISTRRVEINKLREKLFLFDNSNIFCDNT